MSAIVEPKTQWSSRELCQLVGITYRQLDYVCTTTPVDFSPGSGNHRRFTANELDRFSAAKALLDAAACQIQSNSSWPVIVTAVFTGPEPREGWVTLTPDGQVTYSSVAGMGLSGHWRRTWPR